MDTPNYGAYTPLPEHMHTRGYAQRLREFNDLRDAADEGSMQGRALLRQAYNALMRQHDAALARAGR